MPGGASVAESTQILQEHFRMIQLDALPTYAPYRAPRQHGSAIIEPPLSDAQALMRENAERAEDWDWEFAGNSIGQLRKAARDELVPAAVRYTTNYRDFSGSIDPSRPLIMAGHQPELFHPGVWFKNFALSSLAMRLSATAINFVVDNDLRGAPAVRVPVRDASGRITLGSIPVDGPGQSIPYEQHRIVDQRLFHSFDKRLRQAVQHLVDDPCVTMLWRHAREAASRCEYTGCALAQGRHALEAELDLQTLELPLSVACRSRSFATFVLGLLGELPRFHDCYNRAVREYRIGHKIRSSAHPVPELGESDEWLEAPLWIYGDRQPERRPAWVRMQAGHLEISDRQSRTLRVEASTDQRAAADELFSKCNADFKLRPRALITTMYARLILSDLFLHGIGGGKYDQLGDTIVRRFFGLQPPRFMVMSATALLPNVRLPDASETVQAIERRIRDTYFHPETFAANDELDRSLLAEKQELLEAIPPRDQKQAWHKRISELNRRLAGQLDTQRASLQRQLKNASERLREQQLLSSREHPFCIFPLDYLNETFSRLLR